MQQHEPSVLSLSHRIVRGLAIRSADDTGWGHPLWLALLVAASAAFSFVFACATPFAAFGAAAVLTTVAARGVARRLAGASDGVLALATLLAALMVYEGMLFAVAMAWLGGTENFTLPIVGRIFAVNVAVLIGLSALHRVGVAVGFVGPPSLQPSAAGGTA